MLLEFSRVKRVAWLYLLFLLSFLKVKKNYVGVFVISAKLAKFCGLIYFIFSFQ